MLQLPTLPTEKLGMDKGNVGCNIGRLGTDLAEDGSGNCTNTHTEKQVDTKPPASTKTKAGATKWTPADKEAGITTPNSPEVSMIPVKQTDSRQNGTQVRDWPATPSSDSCSFDEDTEVAENLSCFLAWLGLDPHCKRTLDNEMKKLGHYET